MKKYIEVGKMLFILEFTYVRNHPERDKEDYKNEAEFIQDVRPELAGITILENDTEDFRNTRRMDITRPMLIAVRNEVSQVQESGDISGLWD